MNTHPIDFTIILVYLAGITVLGIWFRGRITTSSDYFLGGKNLPWWAVCMSVVATETSTLTFISIPGLAYATNLNFLQIAIGYIIGRIIVSRLFLPAYFRGELKTSYELLNQRFGLNVRRFSSVLFIITRLLADGVRLFATAIPLSLLTGWSVSICIIVIACFTILYTSIGGIRSVVWIDVIQTVLYLSGAAVAGIIILYRLPGGWSDVVSATASDDKFQIFHLGFDVPLGHFFRINYTLLSSLIGGAFLSMASHGTDQIIVQRLLACRTVKESQKALTWSGILVWFQFALFLILGLMLFAYYKGIPMKGDEIMPRFIIEELPVGLSGLIIAAVFAAAMSTLSSSLNSLASSTLFDLFLPKHKISAQAELRLSRIFTLFWGSVFVAGALFFKNTDNPVVELGLAISSFTYGSVLGAFLAATGKRAGNESRMLLGMWTTISFMIWFIGADTSIEILLFTLSGIAGVWIFVKIQHPIYRRLQGLVLCGLVALIVFLPSPALAWPWYVPAGCIIFLLGTGMMNLITSRWEQEFDH